MDVALAISLLTGTDKGLEDEDSPHYLIREIFTNGNCYNFAFALQALLSGSKVFKIVDVSHVFLEHEGRCYDVNGEDPILREYLEMGQVSEIFLEDMRRDDDLDNYSFALRGPMI